MAAEIPQQRGHPLRSTLEDHAVITPTSILEPRRHSAVRLEKGSKETTTATTTTTTTKNRLGSPHSLGHRVPNASASSAVPDDSPAPFKNSTPCGTSCAGQADHNAGSTPSPTSKEHLKRRHVRSPIYCPRCKTVFDDPEERDSHIISRGMDEREPCEDRPFHDETALPWKRALADAFRARVSKSLSLEEQWFSLWRIVFPGVDPPASCLVDDDAICEHVLEYYEFTAARGAGVVRQVIRAHGLLPGTGTHETETGREREGDNRTATAAQLQDFAERVYGLAAETIFRDWVSQRQSSTAHAAVRHGHGHGQHGPPIETNDQGDRRLALPTAQTAPDTTSSHRGAITGRGSGRSSGRKAVPVPAPM